MLGSHNGPAYGSQPKLVVMKVLCKLRWRKIRRPLIFPSLSPSSFILCLPLPVSVFQFIFSPDLSIFLTRCVFLPVSPCYLLFLPSPLSVFRLFHFLCFKLSLIFSIIAHALLPLHSLFPFHAHRSASLPKSVCPSSAVSRRLFFTFSPASVSVPT